MLQVDFLNLYLFMTNIFFCSPGDQILQALENGVSQWPKLEGRFPQVCACSLVL